jgi:sigma-B regulation protein RsbQ
VLSRRKKSSLVGVNSFESIAAMKFGAAGRSAMTVKQSVQLERFTPHFLGNGSHLVVLAHGIGTNQNAWLPQRSVLVEAGFRVMTFDFAGATPETAAYFSPHHHDSLYGFVEDLLFLLHHLELEGITYVGHSIGGMIGLLACVAEPARFEQLILLGSSACYVDDPSSNYLGGFSREAVQQLLEAARTDYAQWANGFAPAVVGEANPHLSSDDFTRHLLTLRPDIVHTMLKAAFMSDHRREVEALDRPLHVLQTTEDIAVPWSAAKWLAEHGKAKSLIKLPSHGHLPHITAPDSVNSALLACLAGRADG